ncbi:MAG: acetyl-CoA C-acyltransferase [Acidobacteria bacterium]|nr:acetyl-CoA C-acyltransferase [Acidobacteriota bacterium]
MPEAVLVEGARTPMRRFLGDLSTVSAIELGATAAAGAIERAGIAPQDVEHVVVGNAQQTSLDAPYGARHVALKAGLPDTTPALTVNRLCGSGIEAIVQVCRMIQSDEIHVGLAGGMENMTQAPHVLYGARGGLRMGDAPLRDSLTGALTDSYCGCAMSTTSDNLARRYSITREDQDEFALLSQQRASAAQSAGILGEEIVPVEIVSRKGSVIIDSDNHLRPETTLESLAQLTSAFGEDSFVTAGNASGIVDGGAATVVASGDWAQERELEVLARIRGWAHAGVDPAHMGIGPAPATEKLLRSLDWDVAAVDVFEVNEAFAGQYLAVESELGLSREKVNVNGGAIALGHPLGMTGTRIAYSAARELRRRGGGKAVATACIGGGQGIALALESR